MLEALWKHFACSLRPISDTDTSNMLIRMLTQGLWIYNVKHQFINPQD